MRRLFRDADGPCLSARGSVVCIGAFDGVHRGHQALLAHVRARADALGCDAAALSFEPLPRQFFQGRLLLPRLATPRQKMAALLRRVDRVGVLRFGPRLAAMKAEDFVETVLAGRLRAREVRVGPGFRFGHGRRGDLALLRDMGERLGFSAHEVDPVVAEGERISSTRIRLALGESEFDLVAALLGRRYEMGGHVVYGRQLGRQLGFPTANFRIPWGRAPVQGIFAVRVTGAGLTAWPSVASLGTRPTVNGVEPLLEAHLFDFDGDLYGRRLSVEFLAKLRDEVRFESLDALVAQMHKDAAQARAILSRGPSLEEALTL